VGVLTSDALLNETDSLDYFNRDHAPAGVNHQVRSDHAAALFKTSDHFQVQAHVDECEEASDYFKRGIIEFKQS